MKPILISILLVILIVLFALPDAMASARVGVEKTRIPRPVDPDLIVSINGPTATNVGSKIWFTPNVQGGKGNYTYEWVVPGKTLRQYRLNALFTEPKSSTFSLRVWDEGRYKVNPKVVTRTINVYPRVVGRTDNFVSAGPPTTARGPNLNGNWRYGNYGKAFIKPTKDNQVSMDLTWDNPGDPKFADQGHYVITGTLTWYVDRVTGRIVRGLIIGDWWCNIYKRAPIEWREHFEAEVRADGKEIRVLPTTTDYNPPHSHGWGTVVLMR